MIRIIEIVLSIIYTERGGDTEREKIFEEKRAAGFFSRGRRIWLLFSLFTQFARSLGQKDKSLGYKLLRVRCVCVVFILFFPKQAQDRPNIFKLFCVFL